MRSAYLKLNILLKLFPAEILQSECTLTNVLFLYYHYDKSLKMVDAFYTVCISM